MSTKKSYVSKKGVLRTYKLQIFGNKNKLLKLDNLLKFWNCEVNKKIKEYWGLEVVKYDR